MKIRLAGEIRLNNTCCTKLFQLKFWNLKQAFFYVAKYEDTPYRRHDLKLQVVHYNS